MQWTGLNELREKYLHYFETKGHLRLGSFPLVPKDDPSLLLINSGMAPMKKWFLPHDSYGDPVFPRQLRQGGDGTHDGLHHDYGVACYRAVLRFNCSRYE